MSAILILSNCDSAEQADAIAEALLRQRLAAAVQTIGPNRSRYRWRGEIHDKQEWLLVIKTARQSAAAVGAVIKSRHGYRMPGLVHLAVTGGEADYLRWIVDNASGSGSS